jgi:hypothetical protein
MSKVQYIMELNHVMIPPSDDIEFLRTKQIVFIHHEMTTVYFNMI